MANRGAFQDRYYGSADAYVQHWWTYTSLFSDVEFVDKDQANTRTIKSQLWVILNWFTCLGKCYYIMALMHTAQIFKLPLHHWTEVTLETGLEVCE